jgi:hypothetical protein
MEGSTVLLAGTAVTIGFVHTLVDQTITCRS